MSHQKKFTRKVNLLDFDKNLYAGQKILLFI